MKTILFTLFCLLIFRFSANSQAKTEQYSGLLNYLDVHEEGYISRDANKLTDVEVIIKFTNAPKQTFGFQLRDDKNKWVRQAMLDLLRNAYQYKLNVIIDYEIIAGTSNGKIRAVRYSIADEDRKMR